ncbi:MAG: helix-turn-helix transcriptional regulator [Clostridia bacterium]|nr:helix-turn-helix transcriptional regulator [Clostridia bacterium]
MNNSRKCNGELNVIGNKIKYYRELNNISYQKLSNMLMLHGVDIHKQSIYNIEIGRRTIVDYEICAFAKCFNIIPNDLLNDYFDNLD